MQAEEYLADPCRASSLPYWKTESMSVPKGITIIRDDLFSGSGCAGKGEPYFKLMQDQSSCYTFTIYFFPQVRGSKARASFSLLTRINSTMSSRSSRV